MRTTPMEVKRWRFTVHAYHRMGEAGILHEDDRVELIEGELVEMAAIGTRHFSCVNRLNRMLVMGVRRRGHRKRPESCKAERVHRAPARHHGDPASRLQESLPMPEDVMLLIEVSDTTLPYDRSVKLPLYARAGIREIWIVDLPAKTIEQYTDPSREGYRRADHSAAGRRWSPSRYPLEPYRGRNPRLTQAEVSMARVRGTDSPSSSSSSVMTKGMRVRMQLPYCPALRSRSPSWRAVSITVCVRSLSGALLPRP